MPTPSTRTPVRVARGAKSDLDTGLSDLQEGEVCYATDENKFYVKEGSSLIEQPGLETAQTFTAGQRGEVTTLTDGANISINLADSNNFTVTLAGNRTLDNPSNIVAGQSGSIFVVQDGTGSRTLAFGSYYDFAGGTAPTLSTAASSVDRIDYIVRSSTSIHAVFTAAYS
tara:strand:- start:75 stop:584 length:510 start_codon:yes stop_codon:yes gene_type:complete